MIDMSRVVLPVPGVDPMRVFCAGMMFVVCHLRMNAMIVVMIVRRHLNHTKAGKLPGKDPFPGMITA